MRYGKGVAEFFQGSVSSNTSLLSMLIRVHKDPQLLGAVRLASTLAATGVAAVAEIGPTVQVPHPDVKAPIEMDLDAPIPLRERQCPGFLPRQAPTLPQLRRIYPVMRGNYEEPHWEFCHRRGLFAVDCRTDGRWDDIAGRYGPYLSGKHAARLDSSMNTAIHPKDREPY